MGGADLLDAARCSSVTTAMLFVVEMLMEMKSDGQSWQSFRVLGRGRVGCARRWTLRVAVNAGLPHNGRVRLVVAHAGAACAHVQCLELCCVRTGCVVGCLALLVRALHVGGVQVGSADGRARHGRVDRARDLVQP